jgi:PAS domain S-box-containing protein
MSEDSDSRPHTVSGDVLGEALDAVQDLVLVLDENGVVDEYTRTVVDVTGYDGTDLTGMHVADLVVDSDRDAVRNALATGRDAVEVTLSTRTGTEIPFEFRFSPLQTAEAARTAVFGRDITARVEDRRERNAHLNRMTDAFFALDEDWELTYVNEQARPILAAAMGEEDTDADLEGRHFWEAVPEARDTAFYETYTKAMEGQESMTLTEYYEPLDVWFEVRAYPSETGLSVYFRDITDRRRQQQSLERHERTLREIYDVTADPDRSFEAKVTYLLELGREVIGVDYGTLSRIEGEDYVFEYVAAADDTFTAGDVVPLAATNCERTASNAETLVLANIAEDAPQMAERAGYQEWGIACYLGAPVFVDGEVYGTFCFYDNEARTEQFSEWEVTLVDLMSQWVSYELTRQRTRERLKRQNEQLSQFTSIVSHDLRNPLNVVGNSLTLAAETGEDEHFERCRRSVERMEQLIEDLLTLGRAGERISDTEPVTLPAVVYGCWGTVPTDEATLVVDAEATFRADESRLRQLLENLVRNALEHAGPDVTITVGDLKDGFYVADDGPGIPDAEREQVFEAGYSTDEDGTGFGLNIVEKIATAHGWEVAVTDSEDGGARFEFTGIDRSSSE